MASSDAFSNGDAAPHAPRRYQLAVGVGGPRDPGDVELARLAAMTLQDARHLSIAERNRILAELGPADRYAMHAIRAQWWRRLDDATTSGRDGSGEA